MDSAKNLPVAPIGAGPIGLAAAGRRHRAEAPLRLFSPRNRGMQ